MAEMLEARPETFAERFGDPGATSVAAPLDGRVLQNGRGGDVVVRRIAAQG